MPIFSSVLISFELSNKPATVYALPISSSQDFDLENLLLKIMFDLPSQSDVEEVIIDTGTVKGHSQPIIVHSKASKTKSEKTSAA